MLHLDKEKTLQAFWATKKSMRQLAEESGLNYRTIAKAIHEAVVSPRKLGQLAEAFEVSPEDLLKYKID